MSARLAFLIIRFSIKIKHIWSLCTETWDAYEHRLSLIGIGIVSNPVPFVASYSELLCTQFCVASVRLVFRIIRKSDYI